MALHPLGIQGTLYPLALHPGLVSFVLRFLPCLTVVSLGATLSVSSMAPTMAVESLAASLSVAEMGAALATLAIAAGVSVQELGASVDVDMGEC